MKKITLSIMFFLVFAINDVYSQTDYYTVLPNNNGTSGNGRAPQGARICSRSVWLITAAEMTASGFSTGSVVNSLGFNLVGAQDIVTTGSMVIYLQNTSDAVNNKSLVWSTAIAGMTTVSNGSINVPNTTGVFDIPFTGGTTFTYTGGALYVAFDYQNLTGTLSTTNNTAICNTSLANGLKGVLAVVGATAVPTALTASNFRPETRLGKSVPCSRPANLSFNTPTLNSATLTYNVTAGGTVDLEYGPYGYTQGTGTSVTNITSPYLLGGLNNSTVYDYYVRKNCGSGVYSDWEGPFPFYTAFIPATPTYTTSFEQEGFPYLGWVESPTNVNGSSWFLNYGASLAQDGVASAVAITPTAVAANQRLFSRGINLVGGEVATVTYWIRNYVSTTAPVSTNTASYQLTVGTNVPPSVSTDIISTETGITSTTYAMKTFNYTPPTSGIYYFDFLHNSPANATGTHALVIDNFTVTQTLSTKDFLDSSFSIFPNPSESLITITNSNAVSINSIEILDVNGRKVKSLKLNKGPECQVNIADLAQGVYMIKIASDKGTVTRKIIKE